MRFDQFAVIAVALSLSACEPESAAEAEAPPRRPAPAACEQVRTVLQKETRNNGLLFEDSGTALVDQATWFRMQDSSRDLIIQSLAMLAQCGAAAPQREVEVTIRNETGAVLITRRVGF